MPRINLKGLMPLVLMSLLAVGLAITGEYFTTQVNPGQTLTPTIEDITPEEAFSLIQDSQGSPDFVILDVRTFEDFAAGHIEGAINMDYYGATLHDVLDLLDKNKTYLVYCGSGGRSGITLYMMAKLKFREAYNMLGGITAWRAAGLPVE